MCADLHCTFKSVHYIILYFDLGMLLLLLMLQNFVYNLYKMFLLLPY